MSWGWDSLRQRNAYQWYEWYEESVDLTLRDDVTWPEWGEQVPRHCGIHRIMASHISASHYSLPNICPHTHWLRHIMSILITGIFAASASDSQHRSLNTPSVIIFSMGSKYLPSPAWCRVIIKNLISGPGDNTSGRHVAHVAPHYNRSLQSANRNARFFSK